MISQNQASLDATTEQTLPLTAVGAKNKSLTLDQRLIIEHGIENYYSKVDIAKAIGKDKSTVGKEIKLHRTLIQASPELVKNCRHYASCIYDHSCEGCEDFQSFYCSRRDRTPGACNGCESYDECPYEKYWYDAQVAQDTYHERLVESRKGINMSNEEIERMWTVIEPLLVSNHSIAEIVDEHPEIGVCQKTLYNYLNHGIFPLDRKGRKWQPQARA